MLGQVVNASRTEPYLCVKIDLDAHALTEILSQSRGLPLGSAATPRGLFVGKMDDALLGAVLRLVRLLDTSGDIPVLAPMILREIHYRLLNGEHGQVIAAMAAAGSNLQKGRANHRRDEDRSRQTTPHRRARREGAHERVVIPSSLQSRDGDEPAAIHEAPAAHARAADPAVREHGRREQAYRVGYESASQFSREYARMFGAPPIRDVEALRGSIVAPLDAERGAAGTRAADFAA